MYLKTLEKTECCGCRACSEICPQKCIEMKEDENGFVYPIVQSELCLQCNLCERVCPMCIDDLAEHQSRDAWAGMHKSADVCFNSSSGGAFSAIYNIALERGFYVYGVAFDADFQVKHMRAVDAEECRAFQKSKYVLSDTNNCFSMVALDLKRGESVLFTGSPCQCAALSCFLKSKHISTENLLIADIICHGAPNQKVFDSYKKEVEQRAKMGSLIQYVFKNKQPLDNKINSRSVAMVFSSGQKEIRLVLLQVIHRLFRV